MSDTRARVQWKFWRRKGSGAADLLHKRLDDIESTLTRIQREQTKANLANEALHEGNDELVQNVAQGFRQLDQQLQRIVMVNSAALDEARQQARTELLDVSVPDLLALVDSLHQAEQAALRLGNNADESNQAWSEGLAQIRARGEDILARWGIEPTSAPGRPFDPELHEAISVTGSRQGVPVIHEEIRRGYIRDKKLLRTAKVVVRYNE